MWIAYVEPFDSISCSCSGKIKIRKTRIGYEFSAEFGSDFFGNQLPDETIKLKCLFIPYFDKNGNLCIEAVKPEVLCPGELYIHVFRDAELRRAIERFGAEYPKMLAEEFKKYVENEKLLSLLERKGSLPGGHEISIIDYVYNANNKTKRIEAAILQGGAPLSACKITPKKKGYCVECMTIGSKMTPERKEELESILEAVFQRLFEQPKKKNAKNNKE